MERHGAETEQPHGKDEAATSTTASTCSIAANSAAVSSADGPRGNGEGTRDVDGTAPLRDDGEGRARETEDRPGHQSHDGEGGDDDDDDDDDGEEDDDDDDDDGEEEEEDDDDDDDLTSDGKGNGKRRRGATRNGTGKRTSSAAARKRRRQGSTAASSSSSSRRGSSSSANGREGAMKGPWNPLEDKKLSDAVELFGTQDWKSVAEMVGQRTAKQCRDRYRLKLDPSINHGPFTKEEDEKLLKLDAGELSRQWTKIAAMLPGRTENAVKSRIASLKRNQNKEWTPEEDAQIRAMKAQNKTFEEMAETLASHRTCHSIKKRWERLFMNELAEKIRQKMPLEPVLPRTTTTVVAASPASSSTHRARLPSSSSLSTSGRAAGGIANKVEGVKIKSPSGAHNSTTNARHGASSRAVSAKSHANPPLAPPSHATTKTSTTPSFPFTTSPTSFVATSPITITSTTSSSSSSAILASNAPSTAAFTSIVAEKPKPRLNRYSTSMSVLLSVIGDHCGDEATHLGGMMGSSSYPHSSGAPSSSSGNNTMTMMMAMSGSPSTSASNPLVSSSSSSPPSTGIATPTSTQTNHHPHQNHAANSNHVSYQSQPSHTQFHGNLLSAPLAHPHPSPAQHQSQSQHTPMQVPLPHW